MKGVVLKASAGTGKTYRLSLEYLAALLKGESYKDILVMTFTKKATSEIQERVIVFLEEMHRDKSSDLYGNLKKLYPDINLSHTNVQKIYYEVLDNRDRLKISTIDGFINNIFKNVIAPYLNIFSYEIIDESDNLEILLKCFEKIVQDREEFSRFKLFLENRTERNIENYLGILKKLIDNRWKLVLIAQSKELLSSKNKYEESISISKIIKHMLTTFEAIKEKKKDGKELSDYMSKTIKWILETPEDRHKEYLLENWNKFLKSEKCWDGRRVKTTAKFDFDSEIEILQRALDELKSEVSKELFNTEVLTFEKEVLFFIENLYRIYDEIKFSEKRFTHLDISSYLFQYIEVKEINLIQDGKITEYFKDVFDSEFKTIFIDEFQDTSVLQWKILKGLINQSGQLICVGDEKQSIYGWRGGEKTLFENLPSIIGVKEETMGVSYRSCKNIVNFINGVFSSISDMYADIERDEENLYSWLFTSVDAKSDELGFFEVIQNQIDEDGKELEEDMILTLVESIETNFDGNYGDVAVIARSNPQLREIAEKLGEKKIPYIIESNDSIIQHRAVNPIFKLLKYSINRDIFSLLEFLRSDVIKIDNMEVKNILNNKIEIENYLFKSEEKLDGSLKELEIILSKVKNILNDGFENRNLVLNILETFNLTDLYSTKSDLKNIFRFLEMSKEFENIFDFYNSLTKENDNPRFKQVSLEEEKAVTLLTIHKSKGLEFETVYYYHQEQKKGVESGVQFHIDFKSPFEGIDNFIFVDKKYEKVLKYLGSDYNFLKELDIKKEQEEINNLYVALTRAKKNLFLVMGKNSNKFLKNSIDGLFDVKCGKISMSQKSNRDIKTINIGLIDSIDFIEKDIQECEQPNRQQLIDIKTEEKRIIGNAIHYYLEFIINNNLEEHREALRRTFSKYASIIGEKRLAGILESEEFKNFFIENPIIFSEEWDYIHPEYEIYDDGRLKRIDRIMIKKPTTSIGEILVVDYKTGGINQNQLDEYIEIIQNHLYNLGELENYNITGKFLELKL
ncbi:exodeoxyribonuclease V subunit beta [uncultured Cetobacterium sp.]|uniref:UvrD-helicase domain-containing protein n=1 Tax=uncultured Cetobacterium sp. TaxID=527638 RepID=UPI0026025AA9|nr:UvrD-helicase domain-containing protein [uncultured Cetobacterium sp.]